MHPIDLMTLPPVSQAWLAAALGAITGLSKLFGGGASSAADARAKEAQIDTQRDRNAIDLYNAQQQAAIQNANLDLNQRQYTLAAPKQRAGTMVRGDLLSTLQKPNGQAGKFNFLSGAPTLSDDTRQGGQQMTRDALLQQMAGDHFAPIQSPKAPTLTPLPQPSKWEQIAGLAGMFGPVAGMIAPLLTKKRPAATSSVAGDDGQ